MNGRFLLDTNIIIECMQNSASVVNFFKKTSGATYYVSVITRMELLSFHKLTTEDENIIHAFLESIKLIPLNANIQEIAIQFRRATRAKMPDAIVAASAIWAKATLVTCDQRLADATFFELQTHNPHKN